MVLYQVHRSGPRSIPGPALQCTQVVSRLSLLRYSLVWCFHWCSSQPPRIRRSSCDWSDFLDRCHCTVHCIHHARRHSSNLCPRQLPPWTLESGKIFPSMRFYCPCMGMFDCPGALLPLCEGIGSHPGVHELDLFGLRRTDAYCTFMVRHWCSEVVQRAEGNDTCKIGWRALGQCWASNVRAGPDWREASAIWFSVIWFGERKVRKGTTNRDKSDWQWCK